MSDASQPPQLRLKPRLKTEADPTQPPPAVPPPPPHTESPKEAQPQSPSLAFKLRAPTPPPTADLAPPPAATPAAPTAEASLPPPLFAPQDPSPATIPATAPTAPRPPAPAFITPDPAPAASVNAESGPRLKLRGKELDAGPAPASSEASAPSEASPVEAEKPATEAAPRKTFKLSSKPPVTPHPHPEGVPPAFLVDTPVVEPAPVPAQSPQPAASAPTTAPTEAGPSTPSPAPSGPPKTPPVTKPDLAPPGVPPRPKIPHFKASEKLNLPAEKLPLGAQPAPKKNTKALRLGALLLLLLVLSGAAYLGYDQFFTPAPAPVTTPAVQKPSPVAATPAAQEKQPSSTPPTAQPTQPTPPASAEGANTDPGSIAHLPSKLISKAQESIAARRNIEQERIDNASDGADIPEGRGFPLSKTGANQAPATPEKQVASYSSIAPGIAATDSNIKTSGKPGTSFRRVVSDLNIRGVFQGSPSRAHINGRIVLAGNPIDKELGIIFVGVNAEEKMLVFRDATGATVSRRY